MGGRSCVQLALPRRAIWSFSWSLTVTLTPRRRELDKATLDHTETCTAGGWGGGEGVALLTQEMLHRAYGPELDGPQSFHHQQEVQEGQPHLL